MTTSARRSDDSAASRFDVSAMASYSEVRPHADIRASALRIGAGSLVKFDEPLALLQIRGQPHAPARVEQDSQADRGVVRCSEVDDSARVALLQHLEVVRREVPDDPIARVPDYRRDRHEGDT
jgi:hypothetical protein